MGGKIAQHFHLLHGHPNKSEADIDSSPFILGLTCQFDPLTPSGSAFYICPYWRDSHSCFKGIEVQTSNRQAKDASRWFESLKALNIVQL